MSDSLKAIDIVIVPASTISANGEVELPVPEPVPDEDEVALVPPSDPADVPPAPDDPAEPPDAPLPDADPAAEAAPVAPAETVSPGDRVASKTTVPPVGAYSRVLPRALCAVRTLASAE
jgi:hypothetical protein